MPPKPIPRTPAFPRRVILERLFDAPVEDVWDLWTTKAGLESWWGPGGFAVQVRKLDLRPGGELRYAMTAVAPEMVEYMKSNGLPVSTEHSATYTEVSPKRRLAYDHVVDFAEVPAYNVSHVVDIEPRREGVRMVLSFEAMHTEEWTQRATMGWEQELEKLRAALAA